MGFVMKLRAALAVTATILAGAVGMGGLSGCALPTGMAGLGSGAGTGLTGTQVADTECHPPTRPGRNRFRTVGNR